MNKKRVAKMVAFRAFGQRLSYKAKGDVEKMMGEMLTQQLGVSDAKKEFFDTAKKKLDKALEEAGKDMDLKDDDVYPYLQRAVMETADEMGLMK